MAIEKNKTWSCRGAAMAFSSWFKNAGNKYLAIIQDPNQDRVRNDLSTFFGSHADIYLAIYEKMRAGGERGGTFPRTWSWTVFLTTFPWFFYRKMYAAGAALIVVPVTLGVLVGSAGNAGVMAATAMFAKTWYVHTALDRLRKANELGLVGVEREEYLRRAGGVSVVAGALSGLLFAALVGLLILPLVIDPKSSH